MRLKYLALLVLAPAFGLAGCASRPTVTGASNTLVLGVPGHHHRRGRIVLRTISGQFKFADGETHSFSAVEQLNPWTGKPFPTGKGLKFVYASQGEDMQRSLVKIFAGSIVPAAIMGGSNIGAAAVLHSGGFVLNNSVNGLSYSAASSVANAVTSVKVKN